MKLRGAVEVTFGRGGGKYHPFSQLEDEELGRHILRVCKAEGVDLTDAPFDVTIHYLSIEKMA